MDKFYIFEKRNLTLKEDDSNAYVEPSSNKSSVSDLSTDISKTMTNNPTDDNFVVDLNHYDNNSNNNPIELSVNAKNAQDASSKIQDTMKNPDIRKLNSKNGITANVHIQNESLCFTKKELNEIIKRF